MQGIVLQQVAVHDFVFPVVAARSDADESDLIKPLVYGTAFCIGPGLFMTAAHVIQSVQADGGHPMLGVLPTETGAPYAGRVAKRLELLPSVDVGLMGVKLAAPAALDWQVEPLGLIDDVSAVGYPYSVDFDDEAKHWKASIRGFKGTVITRRALAHLPGRPLGYEVDARFPKGLSGAPITPHALHPTLRITGMVLGEQSTQFDGEKYTYGIAIDILALENLASELIGGTFGQLRKSLVQRAAKATLLEG